MNKDRIKNRHFHITEVSFFMVNLLIKTAIVYFAVMLSLRVMGKRQLAQLETFDLVTALLISEIASTPLDSPGTPILQGVIPALMLIVLYFLVFYTQKEMM